jgi:hypothetical protein
METGRNNLLWEKQNGLRVLALYTVRFEKIPYLMVRREYNSLALAKKSNKK